jgi:hypothetical protein
MMISSEPVAASSRITGRRRVEQVRQNTTRRAVELGCCVAAPPRAGRSGRSPPRPMTGREQPEHAAGATQRGRRRDADRDDAQRTRSSLGQPMYPSAAAARFAKQQLLGRPLAIDAERRRGA